LLSVDIGLPPALFYSNGIGPVLRSKQSSILGGKSIRVSHPCRAGEAYLLWLRFARDPVLFIGPVLKVFTMPQFFGLLISIGP